MCDQQEAVVEGNDNTRVNSHPCISKGKIARHQVKQLNKTEYVSFGDGGMKTQQDMLIVSIPLG